MGGVRRGNEPELIYVENKLVGVTFEWDHTAEHEWGIKDILYAFGIPTNEDAGDTFGIDRRKVTKIPKGLFWMDTPEGDGFVYDDYLTDPDRRKSWKFSTETKLWDRNIGAAWCGDAFQIRAEADEAKDALNSIYVAMGDKNAVITLTGGSPNPFANAGFVIFIADHLPKEALTYWEDADRETYEMDKVWEAATLGLDTKLQEAGLRAHFLGNPTIRDGKLKGWLNPMKQRSYAAGWYTPDELFAWADNPTDSPVTRKR